MVRSGYTQEDYEKDCHRAELRLAQAQAVDATWVMSRDFLYALHKAGLMPDWPWYTRVVIDAQVGNMVRMYAEHIPNASLLDVALGAKGIEVIRLEMPKANDTAGNSHESHQH